MAGLRPGLGRRGMTHVLLVSIDGVSRTEGSGAISLLFVLEVVVGVNGREDAAGAELAWSTEMDIV